MGLYLCSDKANHKAPQPTQSNTFEKSKVNIHTGMFAARVLSGNKFWVRKYSSKRRPARKTHVVLLAGGCPNMVFFLQYHGSNNVVPTGGVRGKNRAI